MTDARSLADRRVMNTYRRQPVTFVRGEGCYLFDDAGNRYLDLVAGIAVDALGHAHPALTQAVAQQAATLTHTSNLYYTRPMAELADKLCDLLGWDDGKVFFANSGAEANECAIKLVRKRGLRLNSETPRHQVIAADGSFHGRTLATLAATGQPSKWKSFQPQSPGFTHVPFGDVDAIARALGQDVCAVLLEPIQGEGGIVVPPDGYLPAVRALCNPKEVAFVADEVQTGLGRTGRWFAWQHEGASPDVITIAKALGNGLPIAACAARGEFADVLQPGDHATTMGGGPVVCAAALAVLRTIESEGLVESAAAMGERLTTALLATGNDLIAGVRGKGLLLALELKGAFAGDVVTTALSLGLLVNEVSPSAVRLCPPLIITAEQCDEAARILDEACSMVSAGISATGRSESGAKR